MRGTCIGKGENGETGLPRKRGRFLVVRRHTYRTRALARTDEAGSGGRYGKFRAVGCTGGRECGTVSGRQFEREACIEIVIGARDRADTGQCGIGTCQPVGERQQVVACHCSNRAGQRPFGCFDRPGEIAADAPLRSGQIAEGEIVDRQFAVTIEKCRIGLADIEIADGQHIGRDMSRKIADADVVDITGPCLDAGQG